MILSKHYANIPDEVQQVLKQQAERLAGGHSHPPKIGAPTPKGWEPKSYESRAKASLMSNDLLTIPSMIINMIRFYRFYFYGQLPAGSNPHNVLFPIIGAMVRPSSDASEMRHFFNNDHFSESSGFFKTPLADSSFDKPLVRTFSAVPKARLEELDPEERDSQLARYYDHTEESADKFLSHVMKVLRDADGSSISEDFAQLVRLTGYLALVLFRAITKSVEQISRAFHKKVMVDHLTKLVQWPIGNGFSPPCKECIQMCCTELDKGQLHSQIMFSHILWQWMADEEEQDGSMNSILFAGILTHTAGTGMGIILLLFGASDYLRCSFNDLRMHTLDNISSASWSMLAEFICKYVPKDGYTPSVMWARVVDDGYFQDCAAKIHPYLSGIFAGIIAKFQSGGSIKQAVWYTENVVQAENGYKFGEQVPGVMRPAIADAYTAQTAAVRAKVADHSAGLSFRQEPHISSRSDDEVDQILLT